MPFTREELQAYETKPATQVENFDPWKNEQPEAAASASTEPEVKPEVQAESSPAEDSLSDASETVDGSNEAEIPTEAAAVETASESDTEQEAPHGGKGSARERIQELIDERNSLRKYSEYLLEQAKALQSKPQAPAQVVDKADKADPRPTMAEFNFDADAFAKALGEWTERDIDRKVNAKVAGIEVQRSEAALREQFLQRAAAFQAKTPDYDLVLNNPALPAMDDRTITLLFKSEMGPQIAYHLAKNPDLATRISKMDREGQAIAVGRLEAQLTQPAAKPVAKTSTVPVKRTVSQAPPPPKPVSSGTSVAEKPQELLTMQEFAARERQRKLQDMENKRKMRLAMSRR